MSGRQCRLLFLGAGVLLLAAVWLLLPRTAPPLYDSAPAPADPYRFLTSSPPAAVAAKDVPVTGASSPPFIAGSDENPPQAQILVGAGSLPLPPGATTVRVTITPVAPPPIAPAHQRVDGNVYRFALTASGTPVGLRAGAPATIVLRGPSGAGQATVARFDGTGWTTLNSTPIGTIADTYAANVTSLGDVALITSPSSGGGGGGGGGSGATVAVAVGAILLVLVTAAILTIRLARRP
ncbi:MAG: hypothetical protein E6J14_10200 [Chloroflexi bacterium]|nr:MAG: hypothetical protein E6J14_10200 [Chloroflexota bacterium]